MREKSPRPRLPRVQKDINELLSTLPETETLPSPPDGKDIEAAKRLARGESSEKVWESIYGKQLSFDPETARSEVLSVLNKKTPGAFYRMMNDNANPSKDDFVTWLKAHIMAAIKEGKDPFTQGQMRAMEKYMRVMGWGNETKVLKLNANVSPNDMAQMERDIDAVVRK